VAHSNNSHCGVPASSSRRLKTRPPRSAYHTRATAKATANLRTERRKVPTHIKQKRTFVSSLNTTRTGDLQPSSELRYAQSSIRQSSARIAFERREPCLLWTYPQRTYHTVEVLRDGSYAITSSGVDCFLHFRAKPISLAPAPVES